MEEGTITSPEDRIAAVVRAVAASYGGRHAAHRVVMAHSLAKGGNRLAPLLSTMVGNLAQERAIGPIRRGLGRADAFVLSHAFAGVLRAMTSEASDAPSPDEIARALTRLVLGLAV